MLTNRAKTILNRNETQVKIRAAARTVYEVAKASYGPKSGDAMLEMTYGSPVLSHDGVTNLDQIYLEDPTENNAARVIIQASQKNNERVGDGTTAVALLASSLIMKGQEMVASGIGPREVMAKLKEAAEIAHKKIDSLTKPISPEMLEKVAVISAADTELGAMIADVIAEIGLDGGTHIENYDGPGVTNEIVDGFYFPKGFTHLAFATDYQNLKAVYQDVAILLTAKRLSKQTDLGPILDKIALSGIKELVIIGDVTDEALAMLALNKQKGIITVTPVEPPVYDGSRTLFLEDLAVLTGGMVHPEGSNASDFDVKHLGAAEKVVITEHSTTIMGADGEKEEVGKRVKDLQDQLKLATAQVTIQAIKNRLAKLTGKVAIFRVGGAVEAEQGETKFRAQDAICAVQAAIRGGVVPGGGKTLAQVEGTAFDSVFQQPFLQLASNAGLNPEKYLAQLEQLKDWEGFDFSTANPQPVDMETAGILDPALVLHETVTNATSVATRLINVSASVAYQDRSFK